ncbi:MAG: pseudouridine-5'-phosphate glycosidase [Phycisphaerales bacterium]
MTSLPLNAIECRERGPGVVALESTLILHGVPREAALELSADLSRIILAAGARPALVALVRGRAVVGATADELAELLAAPRVAKANSSNLGVLIHRREHGATTVSATMELAAGAGVQVFATGGLGGVHRGFGQRLDISADLGAFTRFPVAVVTSGVKSLLDVPSTREAIETLGIPVVGFRTDRFPAFYLRESEAGVDARFDDERDLAAYLRREMIRTGRGVVVCNPIPEADEIAREEWEVWLAAAEAHANAQSTAGRDVTPVILSKLHEVSGGRTLRANLALVRSNAALAGSLARSMSAL